MRTKFLITIFIFAIGPFSVTAMAQKISKSNSEIIIRTNEGTIRTWVSSENKKITLQTDQLYYGYYMKALFCKQGELQGKPLNGAFKKYDLKDNIIESGYFKNGLKDGLWKSLSSAGNLIEIKEYRKGVINGNRIIYKTGKPDMLEKYRKGKLTGKPKYLNPLTEIKKGENNQKKRSLFHRLFMHKKLDNQVKTKKTPEKTKTPKKTPN